MFQIMNKYFFGQSKQIKSGAVRIAVLFMCFVMLAASCPVNADDGEKSSKALSLKYPEIMGSDCIPDDGEKADFELTKRSRFYIVTEFGDDATKSDGGSDGNDATKSDGGSDGNDTNKNSDSGENEGGKNGKTQEIIQTVVDARLYETVSLMNSLFAAYGLSEDGPLLVFYGHEALAEPGDVLIRMVPGKRSQAYSLDVSDRAVITASSSDGIYYGLLTLMEMLLQADHPQNDEYLYNYYSYETTETQEPEGRPALKSFSFEDEPDLAERAIFLDCGRKYFSPEWIRRLIRRSSLQRYNTLILHFSEASGLRLDSRVFPWLTEDIDSLSMDEMADIVRFARKYHMKVIPSFDVPGHNQFIVEKYSSYVAEHPDFTFEYDGKKYGPVEQGADSDSQETDASEQDPSGLAADGEVQSEQAPDKFSSIANHYTHNGVTMESTRIGIDLTEEHAVAFINALLDDYAEFFRGLGCTVFDISGDEVLGYDSYVIGGELLQHENRWLFVEHWGDYAKNVLGITDGSPADTYISFLNTTAERLEEMGYTCRVFNDEIDINKNQHVELKPSIEISYWNAGRRSGKHFAENGYKMYHCISRWCYFASGRVEGVDIMDGKYYTVNSANIFENWDPYSFSSNSYNPKPVPEESCKGAYFCIWCDEPDYRTDEAIFEETEMRMWAGSEAACRAETTGSISTKSMP